jgi:hypothetical protein
VNAVLCTVSFTQYYRDAVAPGGSVYSAMQKDRVLREFVSSRLSSTGIFHPDEIVYQTISRVMTKTVSGLFLHEFGRWIPLDQIQIIAIEHVKNVHALALVEIHRHDHAGWAEVTTSGRQLERQVLAACGKEPNHMSNWRVYVPEYFEYMFIRRSNNRLLTAIKLHDTLTIIAECPWPTRAGPRRNGRPPKLSR